MLRKSRDSEAIELLKKMLGDPRAVPFEKQKFYGYVRNLVSAKRSVNWVLTNRLWSAIYAEYQNDPNKIAIESVVDLMNKHSHKQKYAVKVVFVKIRSRKVA